LGSNRRTNARRLSSDLDLARNAAPPTAFGSISNHDFFPAPIGRQTSGTSVRQ
jgi:hypothetical protein